MLNKLTAFVRQQALLQPGDLVTCAVSGGADSVALLFALYLLREKLGIELAAAHFNHRLRGTESDRDEAFVRALCHQYDVPLTVGSGCVTPGDKGLEAAARDARYAFLNTLPGKIATAHTADDNAETVLMHLVRGTGLKGLGGIAPVNGRVIRPMLTVTRAEVEAFLKEYYVNYIEDSSNAQDLFLRNRIRHHVMPLLRQENPRLAENLSAMALRLRQDEDCLMGQTDDLAWPPSVAVLRTLHPAQRSRALERLLKESGVPEPEEAHIALAEALVFSERPSASGQFPGGVTLAREYDRLVAMKDQPLPQWSFSCVPATKIVNTPTEFTVKTVGTAVLRFRQSGDSIRLPGGTKSLKKLFIDRKISAAQRGRIPVLADEQGIIGVYGIGVNLDRAAGELPAVTVRFEQKDYYGG